jgi:CBS domain-containing membrane protein
VSDIGKRPAPSAARARAFRLFSPILLGATLPSRLIACLGVTVGIAVTGLICGFAGGRGLHLPLLVAPMGASAVLVFVVPASPLAQPWPTIGGNIISAFVGVAVAYVVPEPALAAGLAAGLAIAAMSFTRSLHPPGGAAALIAAFGGASAAGPDLMFPLFPVGVNACLLVGCGFIFHKLAGSSYPHRVPKAPAHEPATRDLPPAERVGFKQEDIDAALARLGETLDISRADLDVVVREVETQALMREHGGFTCADLMSRDVISIDERAVLSAARARLIAHHVLEMPVVDGQHRVVGMIGLKQLARPAIRVTDVMLKPVSVTADTPASELIRLFTSGAAHTVAIVDDRRHLVGVVTQTDLLAAMSRGLARDLRRGAAA